MGQILYESPDPNFMVKIKPQMQMARKIPNASHVLWTTEPFQKPRDIADIYPFVETVKNVTKWSSLLDAVEMMYHKFIGQLNTPD